MKTYKIRIKEATKRGFAEAECGDSFNFSVPNSKTRRGRVGKKIAHTLDTACNQAVLTEDFRIRRLTPKETWRLQGFSDSAFERASKVNSDTQLYRQAGNSVSVPVIFAIAQRLK
ncbi:DNA cytosine methyltransferase [Bacillus cereus]|uniref:DNA cytosine methyltransferase n=1 Tax=Bacillus cereus TaxID=1396 RepID=A0AAW5L8U0_BACCE|nr:DNA cytosine methyltransferase [Bacillus cereus]MCQ6289064.1 DNA cytosine methyltransferase [Bacillus cereus]MCQ6318534.1 DNA cytosine methyltransferase [Bacillus cereus]MCQ6330800.1 DNA cytosine methyltransferase [Bacillus cereus]MCQ6386091.1 DNA cytosine methyltransferase [Bacillus cereus]